MAVVIVSHGISGTAGAAKIRSTPLGVIDPVSRVEVGDHCVFLVSDWSGRQPLKVVRRSGTVVAATIRRRPSASIAVDGDTMYFVPRTGSHVDRYEFSQDCTEHTRTMFDTSPIDPVAVAIAGGDVWISGAAVSGNGLAQLDVSDGSIVAYPDGGAQVVGLRSRSDRLWGWWSSSIFTTDLETQPGTTIDENSQLGGPISLTADGMSVFAPTFCPGVGSGVIELDGSLAPTPRCYAFSFDYTRAWVAHPTLARITAVADRAPGSPIVETWSTNDGTLISQVPMDIPAKFDVDIDSARISEDGSKLYFVTRNSDGNVDPSLVEMPAVLYNASVAVDAPGRVTYGDSYTVNVHLDAELPIAERTVRLYAARSRGPRRLVATVEVGDDGMFSRRFTARHSLTYTAEWQGDPSHLAQRGGTKVGVRAKLFGRLRGASGTSGDYKLYGRRDPVGYVLGIVPSQDDSVNIRIFRRRTGRWSFLDQAPFRFGNDGVVAVRVVGLPPGRYRLGGVFENRDFVESHSNWSYFKVMGVARGTWQHGRVQLVLAR